MTALEQRTIDQITRHGAMTFRDFMEAALYDPQHGYYNTERPKIGPQGDYYTSSNLHPAFSAILADCFVELRARLLSGAAERSPSRRKAVMAEQRMTIVEMGAGTGKLARGILGSIREDHPSVFGSLEYCILEHSPAMRRTEAETLSEFSDRVRWLEPGDLQSIRAEVSFSNELVDAMPVHRVRFGNNGIEEQYVTVGGHKTRGANRECSMPAEENCRLELCWGPPSSQRLLSFVSRMDILPLPGQIFEVNLGAIDWLTQLSQVIANGYLVTIDYGDVAGHLYASDRPQGTLRSFLRHRVIESPLERMGEQDLTASVNFTALMEYGKDLGFETESYERQSAFLLRNGLIERVARMEQATGTLEDIGDRLALKNLFVPGGASDNFRVLIQRKR
jgi:SAM-dependent MidA family methyltransferase